MVRSEKTLNVGSTFDKFILGYKQIKYGHLKIKEPSSPGYGRLELPSAAATVWRHPLFLERPEIGGVGTGVEAGVETDIHVGSQY